MRRPEGFDAPIHEHPEPRGNIAHRRGPVPRTQTRSFKVMEIISVVGVVFAGLGVLALGVAAILGAIVVLGFTVQHPPLVPLLAIALLTIAAMMGVAQSRARARRSEGER